LGGYVFSRMTSQDDNDTPRPQFLTCIDTEYAEGRCNHRVLFGTPIRVRTLTSREGLTRERYEFPPDVRFALDCWTRNTYGTVRWRCFVCETVGPGEEAQRLPRVTPGARVLLATRGAAQSKLFLAWLALIVAQGVDPVTCPAATFEAAHFRLWGVRADRVPPQRLSGLL